MNYLTQCDDYRAGVKRGAGDWIGDILNTPFALFDVGKELIFGDLTVDKLLEAGLDGLVEDYEYVWDNKAAFSPFKKVCDQDVNELGYHMGKILLDVASAIVGGKLVSSLSKTKTGQKIISKVKGMSKIWTSADKYVGETATAIDAQIPGKVVNVNKITYRPDGTILTDFYIELDNTVIQVKAGTAKGLTSQITKTATGTSKEVIGYAPDLNPSSALVKNASKQGIKVFTSLDDLLNYLK